MKRISVLALTVALLTTACSGKSDKLEVPPATSGMTTASSLAWWSRAAMDTLCSFSVWRGADSGYIAMFAHDGVPIHSYACGWKDIESQQPMTLDTHVRIASMTKPITAVAAMTLVEEGRIGLDDKVADYLPAFANPRLATSSQRGPDGEFPTIAAENPILIRHLLMFASGIGPGREDGSELVDYWNEKGIYRQASGDLAQRLEAVATLPLLEEPGTVWRYGFSADVLARVMEVVTGKTLAELLQARVFDPLDMTNTRFLPPVDERSDMATVYVMSAQGELELAPRPYDNEGWTPGGGGLVSSVSDYMRFALMLWNGGEYQGTRILRQDTLDNMTRLHVPEGVLVREGIDGLGWVLGMAVVADAEASMVPDSDGDFWWSGYYGTTFFVSPGTGLTGIVLSQREPNEYSPRPIEVYLMQGLAHAGLQQ